MVRRFKPLTPQLPDETVEAIRRGLQSPALKAAQEAVTRLDPKDFPSLKGRDHTALRDASLRVQEGFQGAAAQDRPSEPPSAKKLPKHGMRSRGPRPDKLNQVKACMRRFGAEELASMKEEAMAAKFDASRDTCRKARAQVLAEYSSREKGSPDI